MIGEVSHSAKSRVIIGVDPAPKGSATGKVLWDGGAIVDIQCADTLVSEDYVCNCGKKAEWLGCCQECWEHFCAESFWQMVEKTDKKED